MRKRKDLVEAARTVFADAGDAFGSLRALKARARCFMTVANMHTGFLARAMPSVFPTFNGRQQWVCCRAECMAL